MLQPPQVEDSAPPRPPLPNLYDYEDTPPAVPPLPREAAAVVRHTSVRGLKRQSDERKRDRESGQYPINGDCKVTWGSWGVLGGPGVLEAFLGPLGVPQAFMRVITVMETLTISTWPQSHQKELSCLLHYRYIHKEHAFVGMSSRAEYVGCTQEKCAKC